MAGRKFAIQKNIDKAGAGGLCGVVDVPHIAVLRYRNMDELRKQHRLQWGSDPEGICIPITAPDGLLFDVDGVTLKRSKYAVAGGKFQDFATALRQAAELFDSVYLILDPTMGFCTVDAMHIEDIEGDSSSQLCFANETSKMLAGAVLGTAIEQAGSDGRTREKIKGVVIDCVNLFPMGAESERVSLTCFCPSCSKWFEGQRKGLISHFRAFPNPWNLVLKDAGNGIAQISDIPSSRTAEEVVGLSRLKKFADIFSDRGDARLLEGARHLLDYIALRHKQVVGAAHDVFRDALNQLEDLKIKKIIIMEGAEYDWTAGLQLSRLDTPDVASGGFDEIWFHPRAAAIFPKNVKFRAYMFRRSRYFLDAFFQSCFMSSDPTMRASTGVGKLDESEVKQMLHERLATALASQVVSSLDLHVAKSGATETCAGFTSVAFDKEFGELFINDLAIPKGVGRGHTLGTRQDTQDILRLLMSRLGED